VENPSRSVNKTLLLQNRQQTFRIDLRHLRRILRFLMLELLQADSFELAVNILGASEMTRLNETFHRHKGPTDVLAFDYRESPGKTPLCGEIFVCADEARIQATRFRTCWQSELVRYVVHGILHLSGFNDHRSSSRRKMKREESRLLKKLGERFGFEEVGEARTADFRSFGDHKPRENRRGRNR
jgi:probable rRNA maturation factor